MSNDRRTWRSKLGIASLAIGMCCALYLLVFAASGGPPGDVNQEALSLRIQALFALVLVFLGSDVGLILGSIGWRDGSIVGAVGTCLNTITLVASTIAVMRII